jgi:hypothetical protein
MRDQTETTNTQAAAAQPRKSWRQPRLTRLSAGAAENGLTPTTPDAQLSSS